MYQKAGNKRHVLIFFFDSSKLLQILEMHMFAVGLTIKCAFFLVQEVHKETLEHQRKRNLRSNTSVALREQEKNLHALSKNQKSTKHYCKEGILNLRQMKEADGVTLQPLITIQERDLLKSITNCKGIGDVQQLLTISYSNYALSPNCNDILMS